MILDVQPIASLYVLGQIIPQFEAKVIREDGSELVIYVGDSRSEANMVFDQMVANEALGHLDPGFSFRTITGKTPYPLTFLLLCGIKEFC